MCINLDARCPLHNAWLYVPLHEHAGVPPNPAAQAEKYQPISTNGAPARCVIVEVGKRPTIQGADALSVSMKSADALSV